MWRMAAACHAGFSAAVQSAGTTTSYSRRCASAAVNVDDIDHQEHGRRRARVGTGRGRTAAVCRGSYIHPVVIADFNDGKLAEALAAKVKRALRGAGTTSDQHDASALSLEAMRALEPVVARYLAASPRRG